MRSLYSISLVCLCLCSIFGLTIAQEQNDPTETEELECTHEYTSDQAKNGSFNSTGFPQPYPRNKNCTFTFSGTEKFLKINFTQFNLLGGSSKNCSLAKGDLLKLIPGEANGDESHSSVKLYCGKQVPFSVNLNTSSVTVTLVSSWKKFNNSNNGAVGFHANYEFTDKTSSGTNKTSSGLSDLSSGSSLYLMMATLCLVTSSGLGLRFV